MWKIQSSPELIDKYEKIEDESVKRRVNIALGLVEPNESEATNIIAEQAAM